MSKAFTRRALLAGTGAMVAATALGASVPGLPVAPIPAAVRNAPKASELQQLLSLVDVFKRSPVAKQQEVLQALRHKSLQFEPFCRALEKYAAQYQPEASA